MVRRKEHLQRYATETKHSVDQLATRLMLPPRRIEELLAGHAPISNELATHIEEMLQLPASWLDDGGNLVKGVPQMIDAIERPMRTTQDAQTHRQPAGDKKQINAHRRLNLTMLTAERGAKNRLAQLSGTSGSRISLMTSARKPVSDPFAVAIEDGLGLPRGWLDQPRAADEVPAAVWQALGAAGSSEQADQVAAPAPTTGRRTARASSTRQTTTQVAPSTPAAAPAPLPPSKAAPIAGLASTTGLFSKTAGQCGPIAEALAKTIINLSTTDKLSESQAFELLGQVIAASNPKG